jgi:hypothetical protein
MYEVSKNIYFYDVFECGHSLQLRKYPINTCSIIKATSPEISKGFCQYYLERYLEDDKPSSEEGTPANFDIDEISGDNDVQGTDH